MPSHAASITKKDFEYPRSFEEEILKIFANVPLRVLKEKDYSATAERNQDGKKLDIAFHVKDDSQHIGAVSEQIFNFIQFVNAQELDGVSYNNENGVLTFDNAGYVVSALQEYIRQNPDNLEQPMIGDLENQLNEAFAKHMPQNTEENEDYTISKLSYPQTAQAIIGGISNYILSTVGSGKINIAYGEDGSTHKLNLQWLDDADDSEAEKNRVLQELYDDISVLAPDQIKVSFIKDDKPLIEVSSSNALITLKLLENLYENHDLQGREDVLSSYNNDALLEQELGGHFTEIFPETEKRLYPEASRKARRGLISHIYERVVEQGDAYKANLFLVPVMPYVSQKSISIQSAVAAPHTNTTMSFSQIEGLIRTEIGEVTDVRQNHFRLH